MNYTGSVQSLCAVNPSANLPMNCFCCEGVTGIEVLFYFNCDRFRTRSSWESQLPCISKYIAVKDSNKSGLFVFI